MKFKEKFDSYVGPSDTITLEHGGLTYTARIEYDGDSRVENQEYYTARDVERWKKDEWFFCSVVVRVSKHGVTLDDYAASLSGCEANYGADNEFLTETANELLKEAKERGREVLASLMDHPTPPAGDPLALFKVLEYPREVVGRYYLDPVDGARVYYTERADGMRFTYPAYRVEWARDLCLAPVGGKN